MFDISSIASGESSKAANAANRIAGDFDQFLLLLTTQLQNQDPLEPLKTEEFTNQLVQFANVEQSIQSNQNLEDLITLTKLNQQSASLDYIGKTVEIVASEFAYEGGDAKISYYIPEGAAKATIQIIDEAGEVVRTLEADPVAGRHELSWDGEDESGNPMDTGDKFEIKLSAQNDVNSPITGAFTAIYGTVTGVQFNGESSELDMGGVLHSMDLVVSIAMPEPQQQASE